MGTFEVPLEIGDIEGREYRRLEALVDTGATYTTAPASVLRSLGVESRGPADFRLADGRVIQMDMGQTWVRLEGMEAIVPVVFGEEGTQPLLGAVTLEIFRLAVDPVERRLTPVPGLLMARR